MIIIWGSRDFSKLLGNTKAYTCANCNHVNYFCVTRESTWFTLFFIPIFPYKIHHIVACPVCSYGARMPKEQALAEVAGPDTYA